MCPDHDEYMGNSPTVEHEIEYNIPVRESGGSVISGGRRQLPLEEADELDEALDETLDEALEDVCEED